MALCVLPSIAYNTKETSIEAQCVRELAGRQSSSSKLADRLDCDPKGLGVKWSYMETRLPPASYDQRSACIRGQRYATVAMCCCAVCRKGYTTTPPFKNIRSR